MNSRLDQTGVSQQFALATAGFCLLVSLALVALGAISSHYMQAQQQEEYGTALAHQIARRISTALESGDLLSVSASLQRFVETSSAEQVAIFDVEGKAIGQAGKTLGSHPRRYTAPVRIESDVAGEVVITISGDSARAAQLRFILSLLGLSVLLSLAVYGTCRHLGQRLAGRLQAMAGTIKLEEETRDSPVNEVALLEQRIADLPMDLLRTRSDAGPSEENYRKTAALYLHLTSLVDYVDSEGNQPGLTRKPHGVLQYPTGAGIDRSGTAAL